MKPIFKSMFYAIAILLVSPLVAIERSLRALLGRDVMFAGQAELLSLVPGKTGWYVRNAYYYLTLAECPLNCCFVRGMFFVRSDARVGQRVYVGAYSIIGTATLGDDVMLSDRVSILSGRNQHGTSDVSLPYQQQARTFTRVNIGANVWLGTGAIIMADVGAGAIVGAGSVVTKPVEAATVVAGNPAKFLRHAGSETPREVPTY
jgi:virginiamycin A acetyltransferase